MIMADLAEKLRYSLTIPASYENVGGVVEHNKKTGLVETGGEFSLDGILEFFDTPNESLIILDEVMRGDYTNIQRMISIANAMRGMYRDDYGDTTDVMGLGDLIANLVLLREGYTLQELNIETNSFFKRYIDKVFSPTYVDPDKLIQPNSHGVYHTHPFGIKGEKPVGRDLMSKFPSLVLEFKLQDFDGLVDLHLVYLPTGIYSFRVDINKRQYQELK